MRATMRKQFEKVLADKHACYILITCDEPAGEGEMQVNMSYCGDADLASYLVQGAQDYFQDQIACEE